MLEISLEIECGERQSPLDFFIELRTYLREQQKKGKIDAYSLALPSFEGEFKPSFEIFDASTEEEKPLCPECGSLHFIEDKETQETICCGCGYKVKLSKGNPQP